VIGRGRSRAPVASSEPLELRTKDGTSLACTLHEPEGKAFGQLILAHAMFARQSAFVRPGGLAERFRARGWRVLTFDFRGHGQSGTAASKGGTWSYDDLVREDLPAVVEALRARRKRGPIVVLGHSLGGHVALAAQGSGRLRADAFVTVGCNLWLRELATSRALRLIEAASLELFLRVAVRRGYFPARALRLGSDDEALPYVRDLHRFANQGWRSADGRDDYLANLGRVDVPVYAIASTGDRLNARPERVRAFHALCCGPTEVDVVRRSDDGSAAPDHAGLVTSTGAYAAFDRAEAFLRREL
jgi:predicted alpha/beta hydrolase